MSGNLVRKKLDYDRFVFFFQAEDGIRDVAVTGVQTCALPISNSARRTWWIRRSCWQARRGFGRTISASCSEKRCPCPNRICKSSKVERPLRSARAKSRSEEHTSELQSRLHLVCRLLLEKKKTK